MTFDQLVVKCGFGLAVVIAKEIWPPLFWNHMTLEQASQVYEAANDEPKLKAEMWRKIQKTMEPFENVMQVLENVADEKLRGVLIKRLYNTADKFMQLVRVLELDYGGRCGNLALRKMERLANGKREKTILASYTDQQTPLYAELAIYLERSSRSFADEYGVWQVTKGTPLGDRAFGRMVRLGTFAQWHDFYRKYAGTSELKQRAHAECFRLAGNDYKLLAKLDIPEDANWSHLEEFCTKRCQRAGTFAEMLHEYTSAGTHVDPSIRAWLGDELSLAASTFDQCLAAYQNVLPARAAMLAAMRRLQDE